MENNKIVGLLNTLVEINNDRIEGYKKAADETEQPDLKMLFGNFEQLSINCKSALSLEILKFNGVVKEGTTTEGKFFRLWMDLKAAVTGNDRKAILNSCEYGEEAAQETYSETLENGADVLLNEQKLMILDQKAALSSNLNSIKGLLEVIT
jgi:uncharacterized protein (TIGR02284 family)